MSKYVINNFLLSFAVVAIWAFGFSFPSIFAQQYGPSPSHSILIDKLVGKPENNNIKYVDNLSVSDYKFSPSNDVYFQIKVKNTSSEKLSNITVRDYLPEFIDAIEGPGEFDFNNHQITIKAGDFEANQEKVYVLKTRIFNQDKLPSDKGLFCEVNKAEAYNDKAYSIDQSNFCFEKQVGTTPNTPKAGPENNILIISLASLMGFVGFKLRKIN
jgi:hypothetical protein